jgi:DNA repair protein RadA/Sms
MAKVEKDPFRCSECGWTSQKWVGRCGECQAWGCVEEVAAPKKLSLVAGTVSHAATPIGDVDLSMARARETGVSELDRVLGGLQVNQVLESPLFYSLLQRKQQLKV